MRDLWRHPEGRSDKRLALVAKGARQLPRDLWPAEAASGTRRAEEPVRLQVPPAVDVPVQETGHP